MKSETVFGIMLALIMMSISTTILSVQPVKAAGTIYAGGDGWLYRKAHNIIGSPEGNQAYYQMKIIAHYGSGTDNGENVYLNNHSQPDFDDIRFTWYNSSSGSDIECDYWLEEKHDQDNATFWVEIPEINNITDNTIHIYYGNPSASSASNITATWLEYYDPNEDTVGNEPTGWTISEAANTDVSISNAQAKHGTQSVEYSDDNGASVCTAIKSLSGYRALRVIRWVRCSAAGAGAAVHIWDGDVASSIHLTMQGNNYWGTYYDGSWHGLVEWNPNVWYRVEIVSDLDAGNDFNVKINDVWYNDLGTRGTPTEYDKLYHATGIAATGYDVYYDIVVIGKYVEPEPAHGSWGDEEILVPYVVVDQAFVSDERVDVGSVQTVGFHAEWDNGSDVVGGEVYVNGTKYITNNAGWIFFDDVSSVVDGKTWMVTGVNCSGITAYMQTAPTPSVIWDQIKIVDGGVTNESIMAGETATVWFRAIYEYDSVFFEDTDGVLYVNGSEMSWSTNNRWEYDYTASILGQKAFTVTGVSDSLYNLTAINDPIGAQTVTVLGQPTLTVSLDSSTAYVGYKVNISGNLTHPDGTGISGADLLLAYSVTNGETWNEITSATTMAGGEYFAEWMPTATGNYLVRVSWEGNETLYLVGTEAQVTLAVTPIEEEYVFSVVSNSTVSELTFNSTSRTLSFTVSGPSGTTGYTKVTIAKTLIGDINNLNIYLDGNQIDFTVTSTDASYILYFTYQHSAHEVVVSLGPPPFIPPQLITPLSLAILAVILAVAAAVLIFRIRREKTPTILNEA